MMMTAARLLHVGLLALILIFSSSHQSCVPEPITDTDALFCSEELKVTYAEIGDVGCLHIPACNDYILKLVGTWDMPEIEYTKAEAGVSYTVLIADPDAPSRSNPKRKSWRHFLIADVPGEDLSNGNILSGRILSSYSAPSPPKGTGYHQYQISVYRQNPDTKLDLLPEEKESLGNWDLDAFAARNQLGGPVVTTQFMAQNPEDEAKEI